jgi:hypothetical protein
LKNSSAHCVALKEWLSSAGQREEMILFLSKYFSLFLAAQYLFVAAQYLFLAAQYLFVVFQILRLKNVLFAYLRAFILHTFVDSCPVARQKVFVYISKTSIRLSIPECGPLNDSYNMKS